jgi:hypothetical protein
MKQVVLNAIKDCQMVINAKNEYLVILPRIMERFSRIYNPAM